MNLQDLIAHYLALRYPSVLEEFLRAAQVAPPDLGHPPNPDLRTLVEEYVSARTAEQLGKLQMEEASETSLQDLVKIEMPASVRLGGLRRTIEGVGASNLLTVGEAKLPRRRFDLATATYRAEYRSTILTSWVDKSLKLVDYHTGEVETILEPHRAAVLSIAVHPTNPRYIVSGSMDGTTVLTDLITSQSLQTFPSNKFVVRVAFSPDGRYMATASYDRHVVIYEATTSCLPTDVDDAMDESDDAALACSPDLRYEECYRIKVESNPEAILFTPTWLMFTLRASHLLHYVRLATWETHSKSFNPHPMDTHVSFAVLNLALHPSGRIVACQTGDHRGGAEERILLYGVEPVENERLGCLWTGCESDDFVLPRMAWLPDGSGLVTTTPNGYLHLVAISGEVRSTIKVHGASLLGQASSEVVRDCCVVKHGDDWEVVSVGYDRQVRITR